MNIKPWKLAWGMLEKSEKRNALIVLFISIVGAGAQVLMVGSIMPFLSFLSGSDSNGSKIATNALRNIFDIQDPYNLAIILGGTSIFIIIAANALLLLRAYVIARFTLMRVHSISSRLFKSYLQRPYDYFLTRNPADIGKRILAETNEVAASFLQPAAEFISSSIAAVFIIVFLLFLNPAATLIGASCVLVVYFVVFQWSGRYLQKVGEKRVAANQQRFSVIGETFGGLKDIKTSQIENSFQLKFEEASIINARTQISARIASQFPQYIVQACFFAGVIISCLVAIDSGSFSNGEGGLAGLIPMLGVFAFAGQRIVPELQKIYAAASKISYGAAALKSVSEDMQVPASEVYPSHNLRFSGKLWLRNVSYSYPKSDFASVRDVTVGINKGQRVGITGGTGSGKTTLVDIILGLLSPTIGAIEVDDVKIDTPEKLAAWKQKVAYVPQDIFLSDATFYENIAFGIPSDKIDHKKVVECAKVAQVHDLILNLSSEGYMAKTGDRGSKLSGGQRQRIGIARAVYRDAHLIVLDEATSALDSETERKVMKAVEDLPRNITLVFIAHRIDTLRNCDIIWNLNNGRLNMVGTPSEVLGVNEAG